MQAALYAMRAKSCDPAEERKHLLEALCLAYKAVDAFEDSAEFDSLEAEEPRVEALNAVRTLLKVVSTFLVTHIVNTDIQLIASTGH